MNFKEYKQLITEAADEKQKQISEMGLKSVGFGKYKNKDGEEFSWDSKSNSFKKCDDADKEETESDDESEDKTDKEDTEDESESEEETEEESDEETDPKKKNLKKTQ